MRAALSVDLEPNKDGSLDGVREAMAWFDRVVPRGTVFATHRIAADLPGLLADLAASHEIGVHVHPREFGIEHDELAQLDRAHQRELITCTRTAVADAIGVDPAGVGSFRAGRHSAGPTTLGVLADLGFAVDASVNVRYREHLPSAVLDRSAPFRLDATGAFDGDSGKVGDLVEVPTTFTRPRPLTRPWIYTRGGPVMATANTLRTDRFGCSGERALRAALRSSKLFSLYLHPYDATTYHSIENAGPAFRARLERLLESVSTFQGISEAHAVPKVGRLK
jgi:hypothetical protein